jgi:hypothetical protein
VDKGADPTLMTIPEPTNETDTNESVAGTEEVRLSIFEIVDSVTQTPDDESQYEPPIAGGDDPK